MSFFSVTVPLWYASVLSVIQLPYSAFKTNRDPKEKIESKSSSELFPFSKISINAKIVSTGKHCKPCAVDEFEYDFTDTNPLNWDLQQFVYDDHSTTTTIQTHSLNRNNYSFPQQPEYKTHREYTSSIHSQQINDSQSQEFTDNTRTSDSRRITLEDDDYTDDNDSDNDGEYALDDEISMSYHRMRQSLSKQSKSNLKRKSPVASNSELINVEVFPTPRPTRFQSLPTDSLSLSIPKATSFSNLKRRRGGSVMSISSIPKTVSPSSLNESIHSSKDSISVSPRCISPSSIGSIDQPNLESQATEKTRTEHIYQCHKCDASFKVKSYLTRHLKKHSTEKAFVCPFHSSQGVQTLVDDTPGDLESQSINKSGTNCHPTGGFSRRDTFKIHLKALHFVYPTGTKSAERNDTSGRCAGCFKEFKNNNVWLEDHVAQNQCPAMISNYK
ncbi:hypothetical protein CANARDRAFT_5179 [[Candida] arabinofermentans NRRL YB-2248]|uniref:C2H2-type domain-containing protein n=1 Tax=[Candida] arabinofermentans NRRL YB-2248 TaxID=983967 RepID=A0A1E4T7X7_9ASCO|nr:hypothetical protein CANARDRAFT_5179 [[Candida] arabinofermentans NRRL YB-2248]